MMGIKDGFVKIFVCMGLGIVIGGVVVVLKVSDFILLIAFVVEYCFMVD